MTGVTANQFTIAGSTGATNLANSGTISGALFPATATTHTLTYTAGIGGIITGTTPQTVNEGASGTAVTAVSDPGYQFANWSDTSTNNPRTDTNVTANITTTANFTAVASTGGAPKDNVIVYPPSIAIQTPAGGGSYNAGSVIGLSWSAANGTFVKYKVYYSINNGMSWATINDNAMTTALSWTVPDISTTAGAIKVEGYDPNGDLLVSAVSMRNFTINGTLPATNPTPANPPTTPPPATDPTATGTYTPSAALANNPNINTDMGLGSPVNSVINCVSGTLIKNKTLPAVYYCGADGKRYVFVNDNTYFSWYLDFSAVQILTDAQMASIPLGGNITYRPGSRMVKIQSDPKVYVVARGGILRWVSTEAKAKDLFGNDWNKMIDDIPDSFFVNYKIGSSI
jgi:hypothetical protein